jgi:hypothetical protein
MPGDPKKCRENAKRCLKFTQTARTEADRERFEGLATDFEVAKVLLEKWGSGPMTFSDDFVPRVHNPSGQTSIPLPSPESVPCLSHPTTLATKNFI